MKNLITKKQIIALEAEMNASIENVTGTATQIQTAIDEAEEKFHAAILSYDNAKEGFLGNITITLKGEEINLYNII